MAKLSRKNREKLLWELVSDIRNNIDIKDIKKTAVQGITRLLELDRCYIAEYDENEKLLPVDEYSEYLPSEDEKSMVGIDLNAEYDYDYWTKMLIDLYLNNHQDIVFIENSEKYIEENNLHGSKTEKYCIDFNFKSGIAFTVFDNNKIKMIFTVNFKTETKLSKEEIDFLKTYVDQVYIAIKQNLVIIELNKKSEREYFLRKLIETLRGTLDFDTVKHEMVYQIAEFFNADRVFFAEYDLERQTPHINPNNEYRRAESVKSIVGYDSTQIPGFSENIIQAHLQGKDIIFSNLDDYLKENNLTDSPVGNFLREYNFISNVAVNISYGNIFFGNLSIVFEKEREYSLEEINFIKAAANQASIAFYQKKILNEQKKNIEREKILRELVTNTRIMLDIKEIKQTIAKILGESLDADRCFIIDYYQSQQLFFPVQSDFEYLSSPDVKSVVGVESKYEGYSFFAQPDIVKEEVFFSDLEEYLKSNNLVGSYLDNYHHDYDVKSNIGIPITYGDKIFGRLVIHYTKKKFTFTQEDIEFIRSLATQTGIILQQAIFFDNQKKSAERESLLRNIISTIGSTFEINQIKQYIAEAIGKSLKLDRCFIVEYDPDKDVLLPIDKYSEYRSSENIKSVFGYDFSKKEASIFKDWGKNRLEIFASNAIENLEIYKKNINEEAIKYTEEYNIGAAFQVPLFYGDDFLGIFVGHSTNVLSEYTEEEKEFIRTLANQTGIALYQAKLYASEKQSRKREKLLNQIVETIRNTLDLNTMKKEIVTQIGKYLNAERCVLHQIDPKTGKYIIIDESSEYRSSDDIITYTGIDIEKPESVFYKTIFSSENETIAPNFPAYFESLEGVDRKTKDWLYSFGIKSDYVFPVIYQGKLLASLYITYDQRYVYLAAEELDSMRYLTNHIGIALNQAELYETQKKIANREALLRDLIEKIRGSIDIKLIKQNITHALGKALNLDRCLIIEYDPEKDVLMHIEQSSEYIASKQVKSVVGFNYSDESLAFFKDEAKEKIEHFITNIPRDFENLQEPVKNYFVKFDIVSAFQVPLFYGSQFLGVLTGHYSKISDEYIEEDKEFIRTFANQAGIALYQAKLFEKEKQTAEREAVLRKIIETIRSTLDINEIKKTFVNEIGLYFKSDRVVFSEYNSEKKIFLRTDEYSEFSSEYVADSLIGYDWSVCSVQPFIQSLKEQGEINIIDLDKYLKEKNLEESPFAELFKDWQVKSSYNILITYGSEVMGFFCVDYSRENFEIDESGLNFLRALANQAGIALYQAKLFEKEKQTAEREALLRKITETIRSTLDTDKLFELVCNELARLFNVQRTFIVEFEFDDGKKFFVRQEFKAGSHIKGLSDKAFDRRTVEYWGDYLLRQEKKIIIDNIPESDTPYYFKETYKNIGVKSTMGIAIKKGEDKWGWVGVAEYNYYRHWTQEEENLLEAISSQIYIAIKQAELYQYQKQTAEREFLLRRIISDIGSTLDIDQIKQNITQSIGKSFNLDRCFIVEYDPLRDVLMPINEFSEYRASKDIKSVVGYDFSKAGARIFTDWGKRKQEIFVEDASAFIEQNKDKIDPEIKNYVEKYNIKTAIQVSLYFENRYLGILVGHTKSLRGLYMEEEKEFILTLAKQTGIAIYNSKLYVNEKQTAEREALLRTITETIRSNLDINVTLMTICKELLNLFKCQKVTLSKFPNPKDYGEMFTAHDYMLEKDVISISEVEVDKRTVEYWGDYILGQNKNLIINNLEESATPDYFKETNRKLGVKSIIGLSIKSGEDKWGTLALIQTKKFKKWTNEEVKFLESITDQIYLAIKQAELYEFQSETARKESTLRDIISEIKLTRDLGQAYDKLLEKLAEIFSLNRVLFLESSTINPDELNIKYEYVLDREDLSVNNLVFPQICIDDFLNLIHNLKPLVINDVSKCYPEQTSDFFKKYKIKALLAVPLVKYNRETKVLGFIVLCSEYIKMWSEQEIGLLKAISDSVVSVIWEIVRFTEIEDLRNSFILTLAHDFQVPLIGERTALEYLLKYTGDRLGPAKEIVQEILENNTNITTLLNKSVDIYNYESGKKKLNLEVIDIKDILDNSMRKLSKSAEDKSVKISVDETLEYLPVKVDAKEIYKVFCTLIENAIDNSPKDEFIIIKYQKRAKRIITAIQNKGAGIPFDIQQKIFKRYEMAIAIERKIGAGTGLFLSKHIIEAHNGTIWFNTEPEKGATFYVSLPMYVEKN